jgi:hypothetical protein
MTEGLRWKLMLYLTAPDDLRRRRIIVIGVTLVLLLISSLTYAVLVQRSHSSRPSQAEARSGTVEAPEVEATEANELAKLPVTNNPQAFARLVAQAIFEWDTATLVTRADHIKQLVAVGDPTGESTPGLVTDLDNYLPTPDAWQELAKYETRQWLTVEELTTPTQWPVAEAQAGDSLLPGTTALTIDGVRHRTGVWEDAPVSSEHDVSFTVFIVCGPSYPECHLLRLSLPDRPLE